MTQYKLPVEIEPLDEGGYLAICPLIQGCHAQGETVSEALENLEDVAYQLIEIRKEDGLPLPDELKTGELTKLKAELLLTLT